MQQAQKTPALQMIKTRGVPIGISGRQITPVARVISMRWPGGGFTWNRPVAIEVRQGGTVRRLPIHDMTTRVTLTIVLSGLALSALIARFFVKRRTQHDRRETEPGDQNA